MAVSGFLFISWRIFEIVTLIPLMGMLAWFVHGFVISNILTPNYVLILFVASVLALVWALGTLFLYTRARHSGYFVALVDLGFVGTFIGGVVVLRAIGGTSCTSGNTATQLNGSLFYFDGQILPGWYTPCNVLKASFAFGIIECILFFGSMILAVLVGRHWKKENKHEVREERVEKRERHHSSRHSQRRSSRDSRDNYGPPRSNAGTGRRPYY